MWLLDTTQATDAIKVNEFVVRKTLVISRARLKSSLVEVYLN